MFNREELEAAKKKNGEAQYNDGALRKLALDFVVESDKYDYGYQWTWLGLPFIQMPQDIVATQEIIWETKPDVIIETGIAWGGSTVFYASLQQLLGKGKVLAVDLNLRDHVAKQMMGYPFSDRINLYQGSSTDPAIVNQIKAQIEPGQSVMVLLDSNHTHEHVLDELRIYAPLVSKGQYLVVSDTIIETLPPTKHRPRPWGRGNNPMSALKAYLKETDRFVTDETVNRKLLTTFTPEGYLRCIKD